MPRQQRIIPWKGESKTLREWAKQQGLSESTISKRLRRGCTIPQALYPGKLHNGKIPRKTKVRVVVRAEEQQQPTKQQPTKQNGGTLAVLEAMAKLLESDLPTQDKVTLVQLMLGQLIDKLRAGR